MILLNEPYRSLEDRARRQRLCRNLAWLCYGLACMLLGIGFAYLIIHH